MRTASVLAAVWCYWLTLHSMGVSGLDDTGQVQGMLFDGGERAKQSQVDTVADQIKARFGTAAIRRGSGVEIGVKPRRE